MLMLMFEFVYIAQGDRDAAGKKTQRLCYDICRHWFLIFMRAFIIVLRFIYVGWLFVIITYILLLN